MGARHIIELNGKRYDTVTGKVVTSTTSIQSKTQPSKAPSPASHSATIRPIAKATTLTAPPTATRRTPQPGIVDSIRRTRTTKPNNLSRRHPQKSNTLMRQAARAASSPIKPTKSVYPTVTTHSHRGTLGVNTERLERAKTTPQNKRIGRFTATSGPVAAPRVPSPAASSARTSAPPAAPPSLSAMQPAPKARPFEAAIAQATSHTQPKQPATRRRTRRTALKALVVILAIGLVGGFVVYHRIPSAHMKLASSRSGVGGVLPSYTPAGYKLSNTIDYKPGEITLNFQSNSDQRSFNVVQSQSSWNSESLRQDFLEPLQASYQIIEENGKTVYLYDNNATWVDGGIWYKVEAKDAHLSSTQLANLIKSL